MIAQDVAVGDGGAVDRGDDVAPMDAALCGGAAGCTSLTSAPRTCDKPRLRAMSDVTGWIVTPSSPRRTWPLSMSCVMTLRAMFAGMAKPIPMFHPMATGSAS